MRELEEARRKEANTAMDHILQMLVERESRDAAAQAKEMWELEEARRKEASTAIDHFLQMLVEQESRDVAARAKEMVELTSRSCRGQTTTGCISAELSGSFCKACGGKQASVPPTLE